MLIGYKIAALGFYALFAFYVFDIRNKPGMRPIVSPLWTQLMKTLSLIVLAAYAYILVTMKVVTPGDWCGLALTGVGALLVATAKITLGRYHTWTGFHLEKTTIVRTGIYSRLRHPLYTGIFLFEFGGLAVMAPRAVALEPLLILGILPGFAYLMGFNIAMAARESREMERKFGTEFEAYKSSVRAFFPIRRRGGVGG
jgi:protein-S-isoprenylcysteine O-methyltransferase Ste14